MEIRLLIYERALTVLHDDMGRPLIVVDDSSKFSTRSRFHHMFVCSSRTGEDGTARKLLAVNRQIHDEAEDFLYSRNTIFFQNSFDLDHLGKFLESLSNSARSHIRSVGFEVFFFVHAESGVPKRTFKQYEQAGSLLRAILPQWETVVFYIDPFFYFLPQSVGGRDSAARGVMDLSARFRALCGEVVFHTLP
ncbi:hypothetical protein N7523_009222 [Penicillium sp. IBT 18751x]|nr:hypothetical protein N7523_009222 [Penicillium sp. IBT 18751x]